MRTPRRYSAALRRLALIALLSFSFGHEIARAQTEKPKSDISIRSSKDLEADLLKLRDRAEANVNLARRKLQKDPDALAKVKSLYVAAWRNNTLLIDDIQRSIRDGKNPGTSRFFRKRAAEAEESLEEFNVHIETTLIPPSERTKFILPLLAPLVTTLADVVFKQFKARSDAKELERRAQREELAAQFEPIKFREFDKVPN